MPLKILTPETIPQDRDPLILCDCQRGYGAPEAPCPHCDGAGTVPASYAVERGWALILAECPTCCARLLPDVSRTCANCGYTLPVSTTDEKIQFILDLAKELTKSNTRGVVVVIIKADRVSVESSFDDPKDVAYYLRGSADAAANVCYEMAEAADAANAAEPS
jgi:hypothetical protein